MQLYERCNYWSLQLFVCLKLYYVALIFTGQMELFLKGQDAVNDDLPGEDPEVVVEAIDGEAGPLNGMCRHQL